jgi:hypothetical protein
MLNIWIHKVFGVFGNEATQALGRFSQVRED